MASGNTVKKIDIRGWYRTSFCLPPEMQKVRAYYMRPMRAVLSVYRVGCDWYMHHNDLHVREPDCWQAIAR